VVALAIWVAFDYFGCNLQKQRWLRKTRKDAALIPVGLAYVDDNIAQVRIIVKKSRSFFGWLAQFGRDVVVEKPESLAAEYAGYLREIVAGYAGER
jgi:predicted DNA-binding transcriptional regulator YafY